MSDSDARTENGRQTREQQPLRGQLNPKAAARYRREVISFLMRFSQCETGALLSPERPGDLLNLAHDLLRFRLATPVEGVVAGKEIESIAFRLRTHPEQLQAAIKSTRALLAAVADGKQFEWEFEQGSTAVLDAAALKAGDPARRFVYLWPHGFLKQTVVVGAMLALNSEEGAMVRRCARSICGRLFLAARPKQVYCGRQCASAAAFERYKRNLGHEAYRAKHGETALASWRLKQRKLGRTPKQRSKTNRKERKP
jgi:hypothetical protein